MASLPSPPPSPEVLDGALEGVLEGLFEFAEGGRSKSGADVDAATPPALFDARLRLLVPEGGRSGAAGAPLEAPRGTLPRDRLLGALPSSLPITLGACEGNPSSAFCALSNCSAASAGHSGSRARSSACRATWKSSRFVTNSSSRSCCSAVEIGGGAGGRVLRNFENGSSS